MKKILVLLLACFVLYLANSQTLTTAKAKWTVIKNETAKGANTASRIGLAGEDIVAGVRDTLSDFVDKESIQVISGEKAFTSAIVVDTIRSNSDFLKMPTEIYTNNVWNAAGHHSVRDLSTTNMTSDPSNGYASFDAYPTINSTGTLGHVQGLQSRPNYAGSGTLTTLNGAGIQPIVTSGNVTVINGIDISSPSVLSGTVSQKRGIHIGDISGATSGNWSIITDGGLIQFGGMTNSEYNGLKLTGSIYTNQTFYSSNANSSNRNWAWAQNLGGYGVFSLHRSNASGGDPITSGTRYLSFGDQITSTVRVNAPSFYSDTTNTSSVIKGQIAWNADDETLVVGQGGGITQNVGEENFVGVRNNSGHSISSLKGVYSTGVNGLRATIDTASISSFAKSNLIAITTASIGNNTNSKATTFGIIRDENTSGLTASKRAFLGTSGALTNDTTQKIVVEMGHTLVSHNTQGAFFANVKSPLSNDSTLAVSYSTVAPTVNAVKKYISGWDDLMFPFQNGTNGVNPYPVFDQDSLYYTFVTDTTGPSKCIMYMTVQMPHSWEEQSIIYPHIHYKHTTTNGTPNYRIKYKWYDTTGTINTPWKWYDMPNTTGTTNNTVQMSSGSAGISGSGKHISSILLVQVYLVSQSGTGGVNAYQFDIHYKRDRNGSKNITSK